MSFFLFLYKAVNPPPLPQPHHHPHPKKIIAFTDEYRILFHNLHLVNSQIEGADGSSAGDADKILEAEGADGVTAGVEGVEAEGVGDVEKDVV